MTFRVAGSGAQTGKRTNKWNQFPIAHHHEEFLAVAATIYSQSNNKVRTPKRVLQRLEPRTSITRQSEANLETQHRHSGVIQNGSWSPFERSAEYQLPNRVEIKSFQKQNLGAIAGPVSG